MPRQRMMIAVLLVVFAAGLAGCGKKGALQPPPDNDPKFPREFPAR